MDSGREEMDGEKGAGGEREKMENGGKRRWRLEKKGDRLGKHFWTAVWALKGLFLTGEEERWREVLSGLGRNTHTHGQMKGAHSITVYTVPLLKIY